jgi:hypothetical protein
MVQSSVPIAEELFPIRKSPGFFHELFMAFRRVAGTIFLRMDEAR